jgi:GNAT superfamily N-acetyltransferase
MYDIRPVSPDDLELVCRQRRRMFEDAGAADEVLATMTEAFRDWLRPRLATGEYFGWIATLEDQQPVGGIGMMVIDWPPHPLHPLQAGRGYILNLFVEPDHRGRGVAGALMERATQEAERRGLDYMILHATDMGRPMYEKLGWRQTSEMGLGLG